MAEGQQSRQVTAFHEAGHAVAAWVLGYPPTEVSIREDKDSLGRVRHPNPLDGLIRDGLLDLEDGGIEQVEDALVILCAGPLAQRRRFPASEWKDAGSYDFESMSQLLIRLRRVDGSEYEARTDSLLDEHWGQVDRLAQQVLARSALAGRQLEQVLR